MNQGFKGLCGKNSSSPLFLLCFQVAKVITVSREAQSLEIYAWLVLSTRRN